MKERLVSPSVVISKYERVTIRWWVHFLTVGEGSFTCIGVQQQAKGKVELNATLLMKTHTVNSAKTFILYRNQMLRLLAYPKPVRDQLAIELPCLMGFRAKEVCTWRAENIDFRNMNTLVLDAKKKTLFTVPLNLYVAEHAEIVLNGRAEGVVLRSQSDRNRGDELTPTAIWYIWDRWTKEAKLPNAKDISPLTGRQWFACEWFHVQKQPLATLSLIMRHNNAKVTLDYALRLIPYEEVKRNYGRFEEAMARAIHRQFELMSQLQEVKP